jgi:hypothetical protein
MFSPSRCAHQPVGSRCNECAAGPRSGALFRDPPGNCSPCAPYSFAMLETKTRFLPLSTIVQRVRIEPLVGTICEWSLNPRSGPCQIHAHCRASDKLHAGSELAYKSWRGPRSCFEPVAQQPFTLAPVRVDNRQDNPLKLAAD